MPIQKKIPKVKKTIEELLLEGQIKTGETVLDEAKQKAKELEAFAKAALEEARMQRRKQ